jgi:hypothetical protein
MARGKDKVDRLVALAVELGLRTFGRDELEELASLCDVLADAYDEREERRDRSRRKT